MSSKKRQSDKKILVGRIAHSLQGSKIYWTCSTRKCKEIHYFNYIPQESSGARPIYKVACSSCKSNFIATQVKSTYATATLILTKVEVIDDANKGNSK